VSHSINLKPRPSRKPGLFFEALMSAAFKQRAPVLLAGPGLPAATLRIPMLRAPPAEITWNEQRRF
jgi:hypothetical protein